ncbi:MAG: hypothetical protein EBZ48_12305 [Proteobacteria bacterium]|nr:hypothetical protein [Pseudomonadota bacterium]
MRFQSLLSLTLVAVMLGVSAPRVAVAQSRCDKRIAAIKVLKKQAHKSRQAKRAMKNALKRFAYRCGAEFCGQPAFKSCSGELCLQVMPPRKTYTSSPPSMGEFFKDRASYQHAGACIGN